MTQYKSSLKNQQIRITDALAEDAPTIQRDEKPDLLFGILVGLMALAGVLIFIKGCDREPMPAVTKSSAVECNGCHNKPVKNLAEFLRKRGAKSPEALAYGIVNSKSRNPKLLGSIAMVESGGSANARMHGGWKKQYHGPFQTHKRWGTVTDITEAALAADLALETHVAEQKNDIVKGLNAYGGESDLRHGKYAQNVLRELVKEVP